MMAVVADTLLCAGLKLEIHVSIRVIKTRSTVQRAKYSYNTLTTSK